MSYVLSVEHATPIGGRVTILSNEYSVTLTAGRLRAIVCVGVSLLALATGAASVQGQELEPRAYSVSPTGVNFVVVTYGRSTGDIAFDPSLPFEDVTATINSMGIGYLRSLNVLGRSANVLVSLPVIDGSLQGVVFGEFARGTRRGMADPRFRFAINLIGAPAMNLGEFAAYEQDTTLGFSLAVVSPGGQYDSSRTVNLGSNRWAFKPELGLSKRLGRWYLDVYGGVWLFTTNTDFVGQVRRQSPIVSSQIHVTYTVLPRVWVAFNANFYTGGRTEIEGLKGLDFQRNSRIGATVSLPVGERQSLKLSASTGALTTIGADFDAFVVGYQVLWGAGL